MVTTSFQHSSGGVLELVVEDNEFRASFDNSESSNKTIGTTANHPLWSVDRQESVLALLKLTGHINYNACPCSDVLVLMPGMSFGAKRCLAWRIYRRVRFY